MKKKTRATPAAADATPPKPNMPAISATTAKITAQVRSIYVSTGRLSSAITAPTYAKRLNVRIVARRRCQNPATAARISWSVNGFRTSGAALWAVGKLSRP
jgi:hypothetical protein